MDFLRAPASSVVKIEFCRLMKCISDASMARASPGLAGAGTVDNIEGSLPTNVVSCI